MHIRYTGILNDELRGLYLSKANGRNYAVSQLESTDARRMFPSLRRAVFKATFTLTPRSIAATPRSRTARVMSDTPGPGAGRSTR